MLTRFGVLDWKDCDTGSVHDLSRSSETWRTWLRLGPEQSCFTTLTWLSDSPQLESRRSDISRISSQLMVQNKDPLSVTSSVKERAETQLITDRLNLMLESQTEDQWRTLHLWRSAAQMEAVNGSAAAGSTSGGFRIVCPAWHLSTNSNTDTCLVRSCLRDTVRRSVSQSAVHQSRVLQVQRIHLHVQMFPRSNSWLWLVDHWWTCDPEDELMDVSRETSAGMEANDLDWRTLAPPRPVYVGPNQEQLFPTT